MSARNGKAGEKIDDPDRAEAGRPLQAVAGRGGFGDPAQAAWNEILDIHADQVFSIGIVTATLVPVVVSNKLMNVPEEGISSFDPYGYFGVYEMDALLDGRRRQVGPWFF